MSVDEGGRGADAPLEIDSLEEMLFLFSDEVGSIWSACDRASRAPVTVRVVTRSIDEVGREALLAAWTEQIAQSGPRMAAVTAFGTTGRGDPWVAYSGALDPLGAQLVRNPLSLDGWLDLARVLVQALADLHVRGQVHGCLTPGSVLAGDDGWLLADVGSLAAALPLPTGDSAKAEPAPAGIAPEVLDGTKADAASDVFSLGVLLLHSAVGLEMPDVLAAALQSAVASHDRRPSLEDLGVAFDSIGTNDRRAEIFDDDVRFTLYRPSAVAPDEWYTMVAFAHKTETTIDPQLGEINPLDEVDEQARRVLGPSFGLNQSVASDANQAIFRGAELRFVPEMADVEFNPPSRAFRWFEPVHRQDFRFRASRDLNGQRARGRLTVYLGTLIVADLGLSFKVDSTQPSPAKDEPQERESARPYRKVFASYSHRDLALVEQVEVMLQVVDNEFIRDWKYLRSGEIWSERLKELIREADIFELFWSTASMESEFVREEWTYALSLDRGGRFVRPVFWEDPFPEHPERDLPPPELSALEFTRLPVANTSAAPSAAADTFPVPAVDSRDMPQTPAVPSSVTPAASPAPPAESWRHGAPLEDQAQYDVGPQAASMNDVARDESKVHKANYFPQSTLRYLAARRALARRLIVSGSTSFLVGGASALFAILYSAFNGVGVQASNLPEGARAVRAHGRPAFGLVFGIGVFLILVGLALLIFGLITRRRTKRDAVRMEAPW